MAEKMQASGVLTDGMMPKTKAFEPGKVMQKRAESEHGTVEAMRATPARRTPGEPQAEQGDYSLSRGVPSVCAPAAARYRGRTLPEVRREQR